MKLDYDTLGEKYFFIVFSQKFMRKTLNYFNYDVINCIIFFGWTYLQLTKDKSEEIAVILRFKTVLSNINSRSLCKKKQKNRNKKTTTTIPWEKIQDTKNVLYCEKIGPAQCLLWGVLLINLTSSLNKKDVIWYTLFIVVFFKTMPYMSKLYERFWKFADWKYTLYRLHLTIC